MDIGYIYRLWIMNFIVLVIGRGLNPTSHVNHTPIKSQHINLVSSNKLIVETSPPPWSAWPLDIFSPMSPV